MPPNSRFDDRRPSKNNLLKSDLQIRKNCKFRNLQSNEQNFNKLNNIEINSKNNSIEFKIKSKYKNQILKSFKIKFKNFKSSLFEFKISRFISTCTIFNQLNKSSELISRKKSIKFNKITCYAFIILISILIYLPCLNNEFVFDDMPAILHNKIVQVQTPFTNFIQLFTTDYWGSLINSEKSHKSYRPFTIFTFRLNFWFGKLEPFGYQLINIILHCLNSLLNYRFINYFLKNESSFITAVLFTIHSIHVDAVASIVGRAELLSALFLLITFNLRLTIKRQLNLFLLFILTIFALFSKEQGITILPLIIMYETLFNTIDSSKLNENKSTNKQNKLKNKNNLKQKLAIQFNNYLNLIKNMFNSTYNCKLLIVIILILFIRCNLLHNLPNFSRFDNPLTTFKTPFKQLNYLYIWLFNLYKFIYPYSLACDWSAQSIQLLNSASPFIILLLLLTLSLIALIHQIIRLNNFKLLFFISFSIITFLPASNIFFTVGFLFAERVLYLPSIGLCAIFGYCYQTILDNLNKKNKSKYNQFKRNLIRLIILLILCLNAYRSYIRTFDWQSEKSLYNKDLETNPKNIKLLNNLGKIYEQENNYDKAFDYYLKAIKIEPLDSRGFLNAGNLYSKLGNDVEAENYYRMAIKTMPSLNNNGLKSSTFFNKFKTPLNENDQLMFNKNIHHHKQTDTLEHLVSTMQLKSALNLANLLSNNPLKTSEANKLYEQLIAIKPNYGDTYLSWIESILKSNSSDLRTIKHVLVQLLHNAKHLDVNVLYNVAVLISNSGNSMMALQLFDQILKLNPKHEESLVTSARIIRKNSEFNQLHEVAIERLEKFVSLNQLDPDVFFELGMLYINFNIQKSIEYLHKAIQIKPDFSQALFNLSLLLYRQQRAEEAIPFLELLLKQDDSHQKAMMLLFAINYNKHD